MPFGREASPLPLGEGWAELPKVPRASARGMAVKGKVFQRALSIVLALTPALSLKEREKQAVGERA